MISLNVGVASQSMSSLGNLGEMEMEMHDASGFFRPVSDLTYGLQIICSL